MPMRTWMIVLCLAVLPGWLQADEDDWGIKVAEYYGNDRVNLADNCAGHLKNVEGLDPKQISVFHDREASIVFYGRYKRVYTDETNQTLFNPDPNPPLNLIRSLSMEDRRRQIIWPFRLATMSAYPVPMTVPRQWKLEYNPGHYSLQVAVFYNTKEMRKRRSAADQYCKLLREKGEQAYVHHGPVHSSVCIGAFPKTALKTVRQTNPMTNRVQVAQRIVDPKMLALQQKYPNHLQNGARMFQVARDRRTQQKVRDAHLSFPVEVPKRDPFAGVGG